MTATTSSGGANADAGGEDGAVKTPPKKKKAAPPPTPKPEVLTLTNGTLEIVRIAVCFGNETAGIVGEKPWKIVKLIAKQTEKIVPPESFDASIQWVSTDKNISVKASKDKKNTVQITEVLESGDSPITETGLIPESGKIFVTYTPFLEVLVTLNGGDGEIVYGPGSFVPTTTLTLDVNDYQIAVVTDSAHVGVPLQTGQVKPNAFHMKAGQTALLTGPFRDGYVFDVNNSVAPP